MDSELQASPDASTPSIQPAELPPRPAGSPSVAAAGAVGALLGALLVVAFGDAVWSGKTDASKLSLDIEAAATAPRIAPANDVLAALGTVALDPEHVATVTIPGPGVVRHVASFEGDRVRAGSLLAVIQSPNANRDPTARYELLSPIEGTVIERSLHPSDDVEPEVLAFRVANLDHLKVDLRLKKSDARHLRVGDRAELSPLAAHELFVDGSVAAISERTPEESTVSVRVSDPHHYLREGDGVRAHLYSAAAGGDRATLL
ncbi:MAG TPA: efflux RND transporter periplasmic adaptor subunit [Polyangiaceae bacterium]|nr:efflux RND transporter periplasmic adaptor subunit [Polyangiaceae bacterium]